MRYRVCYRCDWEGRTFSATCPRCGAPLYRAGTEEGGHAREAPPGSIPAAGAGPPPPAGRSRRRRVGTATVVLVGLAALAGGALILTGRDGAPPPPPPLELSGRLVYVTDAGGRTSLAAYDLAEGTVALGPEVDFPTELRATPDGAVAYTVDGPTGQTAFLVDALDPEDRPVEVATGTLVAWSHDGRTVYVAVQEEDAMDAAGCRAYRVRVAGVEVETGEETAVLDEVVPCGGIGSLAPGRDPAHAFYTRVSEGRADVYEASGGAGRAVLEGYVLLSASPIGDLLVAPDRGQGRPGPTILYRRQRGGLVDIATEVGGLHTDRVLAWSGSGDRLVVVGEVAGDRGVWVVESGQGPDRRSPDPFGPRDVAAWPGACFGSGAMLLIVEGRLLIQAEDRVEELGLGRPPAEGSPAVWLR
ncbi:MAG: hypothetical protein HY658_11400 [Actinobacteria bacterium]|nr:hypothetical protein [Actinomycetota bacterium]